jgi:hypothetical protein
MLAVVSTSRAYELTTHTLGNGLKVIVSEDRLPWSL